MANSKFGFIDQTGKEIIPIQYTTALNFNEGLSLVKVDSVWGYIEKEGLDDQLFIYNEGISTSKKRMNPNLNKQLNKYEKIGNFYEGAAWAIRKNKYGFIDDNGKEFIPAIYDRAYIFAEGLASVKKGNKWGYINKSNSIKITYKYDWALPFSEGLASVQINNKWGYIDKSGKLLIDTVYEAAWRFSEGLAAAQYKGRWGFIDKKGDFVIEPKYMRVYPFINGLGAATLDDEGPDRQWFYIDRYGNEYYKP